MDLIVIASGEDGSWMMDRNIDCWAVNMLDCVACEIVGLNFSWQKVATRNQNGFSIPGHNYGSKDNLPVWRKLHLLALNQSDQIQSEFDNFI